MKKLTISSRLSLLVGLLSVLLLGIGLLGLYGISRANEGLRVVYLDRTVPATYLGRIQSDLLASRLAVTMPLAIPTPENIEAAQQIIRKSTEEIADLWKNYSTGPFSDDEAKLVQQFNENYSKFLNEGLNPTMQAVATYDLSQAKQLLGRTLPQLYESAKHDMDALAQLQIDQARQEYDNATGRYQGIRAIAIGAVAAGLALAVALGWMTVRGLVRELGAEPGAAADLVQGVARGDLTAAIRLRSGDHSSLMSHLREMQASLTRVVTTVRHNADSVATASAEIAQGNADLSVRTEQQAAALEQTAASMERLDGTVRHNADNARQANQLAQGASAIATRGGDVVHQVVTTMREINDSSRKIADIISVIDGIAFQTNILALNAAVEAARAGEQGRGFAVVAGEVRSLAQRSAEAARQIKELINTSVARVEQGSTLVDQAGETMQEIVVAIQRVTDIVGEISSASVEQSEGVSQISQAIGDMERTTQQNAALVEQSSAAAESLKQQAAQMVEAVSVFRLNQAHAVTESVTVATSSRKASLPLLSKPRLQLPA
ncbi:methyl-accepting chemotaxis protein [Hydrogenophaga aquatica]